MPPQVALAVMRRSVRKRAGFSIDDVAPLNNAGGSFIPALFGEREQSTYLAVGVVGRLLRKFIHKLRGKGG